MMGLDQKTCPLFIPTIVSARVQAYAHLHSNYPQNRPGSIRALDMTWTRANSQVGYLVRCTVRLLMVHYVFFVDLDLSLAARATAALDANTFSTHDASWK